MKFTYSFTNLRREIRLRKEGVLFIQLLVTAIYQKKKLLVS